MTTTTRTRQPNPPQQARALAELRPRTPDGYAATRRALLILAQSAKQEDRSIYAGVVQVMVDVRAAVATELAQTAKATMRDKRNPPGNDPLTRWYAGQLGEATPASSPTQQQRELSQRQNAVTGQLRQRDAARMAANALAHALWAVHQGERDWTPLATKPSILQAQAPTGQPSGSVSGPSYLEVTVPGSEFGPSQTLRLFRVDYERLLALWGYDRVARASRLRQKLRGAGSPPDDVEALFTLALDGSTAPNLAHAWHGYVTGTRLGDVFSAHSSGTVQLAPRRNGDLRQAVMELHAQCQQVEFCTGGQVC
ncbi:hypothetical protein [Deinococcus marmoris]|uniref:hypothetical protein n=1 Tax=Deinococcus marmoris TaxID=249408 RepID=UPI0004984FA6|nr:hypothetical protein [Deinococcus marmoris]